MASPPAPTLAAGEGEQLLTTAAEVRGLSPEAAARSLPVRLRGVVTFWRDDFYARFVQDGTAGIYVGAASNTPPLVPGQLVEVEGITSPGEFAPIIRPMRVRVVGEAPLPAPRPITSEQLASGQEDSQFVELTGIVRAVEFKPAYRHYIIALATGGRRLTAFLRDLPVSEPERLVDATVRVRGVCSTQFNRQRQLFAISLMVPLPAHLVVEKPSSPDPFAVPTRRMGSLLQFAPQGGYGHRVKVAGTVVHQQPGRAVFFQEGGFGLRAETRQQSPLRPGDRVEVVGFPAWGTYTPILEDAVFRKVAEAAPPAPIEVDVDGALSGAHDCRLVRLRAKLLDRARQSREPFLVLEAGGFVFPAHFDSQPGADALAGLRNGSQLALTGICLIEPANWQAGPEGRAKSFRLLLRSPADVEVLAAPPWWTLEKLLWTTGGLGVIVLAAFAWVAILRRRVQHQTGIIRERLQVEAALKERYLALFENANDMVFAHDLHGRLTSLNRAGERLLRRPREQLLGTPLADLIAEDQRDAARRWIELVLCGAEAPPAEWDVVNAAGQRLTLEVGGRLIEQDGRPAEVEGIARDITERRRLERELLEVSSREQRRIGHDLHDGVCQQLAGIAYRLDILGDRLQERALPEAAEADKIAALLGEATRQARSVAHGLFPIRLEEDGLVSALESLADNAGQCFPVACVFHCPAPPAAVDNEVALHVYYIAQEALLNAVKHGQARRVELALETAGEHFRLRVRDDGAGFQPDRPSPTGLGIRIMRYRAKVIGASLDLRSQPGQGAEVACLFHPGRRTTPTTNP